MSNKEQITCPAFSVSKVSISCPKSLEKCLSDIIIKA